MAGTTTRVLFFLALLIGSFALSQARLAMFIPPGLLGHNNACKSCKFDRIYQFSDSISDTGNLIREGEALGPAAAAFARLPYGETFFKHATGRCSNVMLMIDYITLAAGLPLLNPYENAEADFRHGVNFAVAGSTALSAQALGEKNIGSPITNSSLRMQLDWMSKHLNSTCHRDEGSSFHVQLATHCAKMLKNSLIMVPAVVQAIKNATNRVIQDGAVRVIVPGNFRIGCLPIYLTAFETNDSVAYDGHHCLKSFNNFAMYHNEHLQQAIKELKEEYHNATIVIGGDYDLSLGRMCGAPSVPVCDDPNRHICWDGHGLFVTSSQNLDVTINLD
ncbi:hypothetical protein RJ640_010600 [Escallonia rubra]|uniref:Uncharacterized protein n=1 Tax=Escallonia rubra TaxID=112253 RepID=A0AA88U7C0_9ASTE|nr:hypothetical protein RJ640_010600 [Escallonia rubra]